MTDAPLETVAPDEGDPDTGNLPVEEYESQGDTVVATRRGYRFAPADKNVPVVTHVGLKVGSRQAEDLVKESDGVVFIVPEEKESTDAR